MMSFEWPTLLAEQDNYDLLYSCTESFIELRPEYQLQQESNKIQQQSQYFSSSTYKQTQTQTRLVLEEPQLNQVEPLPVEPPPQQHPYPAIFYEIDDQLREIFDERNRDLERKRKEKKRALDQEGRRKKAAAAIHLAAVSSQPEQVPPTDQITTCTECSCNGICQIDIKQAPEQSRTSRSRPEGMLLYPLPKWDDEYMMKIDQKFKILFPYEEDYKRWQVGNGFMHIDRALAHWHFAAYKFDQVQVIISRMCDSLSYSIPKILESEVEELWHNAGYHLEVKYDPKMMNSVRKYRLRKKNACPTERDQKKKYKISDSTRFALLEIYSKSPILSLADREWLQEQHGLTKSQILNWFKNRRQRAKASSSSSSPSPSNKGYH